MIPIARPVLGPEEAAAAVRAVESGWITQGPEVAAFEQEFARQVGAPHACAVANCTAALHLALLALGIGPGDEVITVSHSFIATANAIRHCGAVPVFVDVEADSFNMDPTLIEPAITPRTRAILCVHQMGMPCALEPIAEIARRHSLRLIEDAACAIGSEIFRQGSWQRIGRPAGDVACFSFHPRKVLTTGDGGMVTTRDPELAERIRLLRQHGMSINDRVRHAATAVVFEAYPIVGYNYRMTDLSAAIGRVQLARLDELLTRRRQLAARYDALIEQALPMIERPAEPDWARSNWQSYCIRLPSFIDQRGIMQEMLDRGVATRRGIMCAHREAAYRDLHDKHSLPVSEYCQDHGILLPLFSQMTTAQQEHVVNTLKYICTLQKYDPVVPDADPEFQINDNV